ncbi:hypothetical protein [Candidatus Methylacidiphilum infernorum]|uniref:Opacity protein or related surface antigen n=1 Tax=Methylacidiphilum infernorum (isolate V4) TaxID=481448 RepID=B3DWD8_METI4|nr:hypothetical protein [Candidatus Methylacidiphilum infernorum]ACD83641.1 Hypothetical protein Minf_1587 [Methylacidiphilum infernorum V4]
MKMFYHKYIKKITISIAMLITSSCISLFANTDNDIIINKDDDYSKSYDEQKKKLIEHNEINKPKPYHLFVLGGFGPAFPYSGTSTLNGMTTDVAKNYSYVPAVQVGILWYDPDRWKHLTFGVAFVGAFLGNQSLSYVQGLQKMDNNSAIGGFLGLAAIVGYVTGKFVPYVGVAGGGVLLSLESSNINLGSVWGSWYSPVVGFNYLIDKHWFTGASLFWLFDQNLNGYHNTQAGIRSFNLNQVYEPLLTANLGFMF